MVAVCYCNSTILHKVALVKALNFPCLSIAAPIETLAYSRRRGDNDRESLDAVMTTLTKIARGGIRDHIAGGLLAMPTIRSGWCLPRKEVIRQRADAAAVGRSPYPGG